MKKGNALKSLCIVLGIALAAGCVAAFLPAQEGGAWYWSAWDETKDYCLPHFGGWCHGVYDHADGTYRRWYGGDAWGSPSAPPIPPRVRDISDWKARQPAGPPNGVIRPAPADEPAALPTGVIRDPQPMTPTGVVGTRISSTERYTYKGQPVTRTEVETLIGGKEDPSKLIDDSQRDRLIVQSADKAKRAAFLKAFATDPAYARLREKCSPWEADPADWSLELGHARGEGVVIVQAPSGEVLARAQVPDITDSARIVGEIRKANPLYDPAKDPTPANPAGALGLPHDAPAIAVTAALFATGFFALRRKR